MSSHVQGGTMRYVVYAVIVGLLAWSVGRLGAQDAVPTVPPEQLQMLLPAPPFFAYREETYELAAEMYNTSLHSISLRLDICPELIFDANLGVLSQYFEVVDASDKEIQQRLIFRDLHLPEAITLTIPAHNWCYTKIEVVDTKDLPRIEKEKNICQEEFVDWTQKNYADPRYYAIRLDALPCINEEGQRLIYRQIGQRWFPDGYSDLPWIDGPEDFTGLGYCVDAIKAVNPALDLPQDRLNDSPRYYYSPYGYQTQYPTGSRIFIPRNSPECKFVLAQDNSLYEVSQKYNVCMESILDSSNITMYDEETTFFLSIPLSAPPCYNDKGQRLSTPSEMVYETRIGETFLEIAEKYDICMDALWDANPLMERWDGLSYRLPDVMFIPDERPCEFTRTMTSRPIMSLLGVATLSNVCRNRIYEDNPQLQLKGPEGGDPWPNPYLFEEKFPAGKTITFRDGRPPCYRLTSQAHIEQIFYVCYPVPVTPQSDFTGYDPPISFSSTLDLPYCYETRPNMTVIYENRPYTLYRTWSDETNLMIAECFGVDIDVLEKINTAFWGEGWSWPNVPGYYNRLLIPQPHKQDCWLLSDDENVYIKGYRDHKYGTGWETAVFHTVQEGETLSEIARQYGYLTSMIVAENDLDLSYDLQIGTKLRMPSFPSFYDIGRAALYVGGVGIGFAVLVLYRMRRRPNGKSKKKNDAV